MQRLSEIDLPALVPGIPRWVIDIAVAVACFGLMALCRLALQVVSPGAAPYALLFPFSLIAVFLGSWRAGAITFALGLLGAWYAVLPPAGFKPLLDGERDQMLVVIVAGVVTLAVAQLIRRSARRAASERAKKLEERELMLRELNHRVNNNFAMVASLLQMQAARSQDPGAKSALANALSRVMSISQAHRNLYAPGHDMRQVDMSVYLQDLARSLAEALFLGEIVALDCDAAAVSMERDRAVAIGLVVNELVTNAAKHAFTDGNGGRIQVRFEPAGQGWRLTVRDDGNGLPANYNQSNGLGHGLVEAFARQAKGVLSISDGPGATFVLDLKP